MVGGFTRVHEVNRHLHPFHVKRGIYWLTDHVYDISIPTLYNYLVTTLLIKTIKMHRKTWYAGMCGMNGHGLTI
jgi:hypothetical protein